MRTSSFLLAATALTLGISASALAQDVPLHVSQPAAQNVSNTSAQPSSTSSPSQAAQSASRDNLVIMDPSPAASLGDVARLARAKKSSQAKSVKIFNDDNMPHAPLSSGEKAPGFAGQGSSSGGKVTVLDFWATWCGPCRHALPGLKQLQAIYGADKVEVISISEDEDEGTWQSFVAQNQMNWTQRIDSDHQMMRQYGASALPTYVLIGKDGNVVQQYVGDDPGEPILERMEPDLKRTLGGNS
jgi:cytochrome c biogenesis protein CcmG/thiol:disulfide interchange protein DsbE